MSVTTHEDPFVDAMNDASDFLSHYGVKGMKWGKRTTRPDEAARKAKFAPKTKSGLVKDSASDDAIRVNGVHVKVVKNKSLKPLSNKELQDAITRMNLEQQYSRMTGGLEKTKVEKAKAFMSKLVKDSVEETVKSAAKTQVKEVIEKKTSSGKYDPLVVAKREADLASARARTRQANVS